MGGDAVDAVCADPTVDAAAIIADLKAWAVDGLNEVEVNVAAHADEYNITDFEIFGLDGFQRD